MNEILKKIDGWKTAIAALYWPIATQALPIWYPDGVPPDVNKIMITVGIVLTSVGVGHKWHKKTQEKE